MRSVSTTLVGRNYASMNPIYRAASISGLLDHTWDTGNRERNRFIPNDVHRTVSSTLRAQIPPGRGPGRSRRNP
mgnify:CR=1 FL=1